MSHLRHCPKHKKPLPCPHCALAAKTAPTVEALPQPKRRGRPPKFGIAMTAAERKAASRAWKKEKQQDAERRNLIAELMNIYRRQQAMIISDKNRKATEERIKGAGEQRRQYLNDLEHLNLTTLQVLLKTEKETPDSHGRLHNERSGEAEHSTDQSEMETIIAARQHDTSLFEVDDPEAATEEAKQMAAGFRVRPQGAGPDTSDKEDDKADKPASSPIPDWTLTANEKWLKEAIISIVGKLNLNFDSDGARCPFCNEVFLVTDSATNHLEEQYEKDNRDYQKWFDLMWSLSRIHEQRGPYVDPGPHPQILHWQGIQAEAELVKKKARKKPKKP